jgi:peptide-methionine (S)-S-oxide reductase
MNLPFLCFPPCINQLEFDPSVISYEKILDIFWKEHSPKYKSKAQYKSAIWTTTEEQMRIALQSRADIVGRYGAVATDIEPAKTWWDAEEYHQKYVEKQQSRRW